MGIIERTWDRFSTWINGTRSTLSRSPGYVEVDVQEQQNILALDNALRNRVAALDESEKLIEERERKLVAREREEARNATSGFDGDRCPVEENSDDTDGRTLREGKTEASKIKVSDHLDGPVYQSSNSNYQLGRDIIDRAGGDRSRSKNELRDMYVLFRRASERGHVEATYELSLCYADGRGVAASGSRARALLLAAARSGSCRAQHTIGRFMLQGNLFPLNPSQALYWIRKASAQNYAPAVELLKMYPEAQTRTLVSASVSVRRACL